MTETVFSVLFRHMLSNMFLESTQSTLSSITSTPVISSQQNLWLHRNREIDIKEELDCRGPYGCFPTDYPWESAERPISLPPHQLQDMKPFFCIHSIHRPDCSVINMTAKSILSRLDINSRSLLVVLTHGYLDSVERSWMKHMVKSLLYNYENRLRVITVDWRNGAKPPYAQSVANTRVLGNFIGRLLELIMKDVKLSSANIHLVGHSLGAQMFGYTGKYLLNKEYLIGRITGMDPAGPYFKGTPKQVRLDASDAFLVDIIHTDSPSSSAPLPFGMGSSDLSGHLDFFPNGGMDQNNCRKSPQEHMLHEKDETEGFLEIVSCNHKTSYRYFTTSINKECTYIGIECSSWEKFKAGQCWGCDQNRCFQMGMHLKRIHTSKHIPKTEITQEISLGNTGTKLYLVTTTNELLCGNQLRFTLATLSSDEAVSSGGEFVKFSLIIKGTHGTVETMPYTTSRFLDPGSEVVWVDAVPETLGEIHSILFHYYEEGFFNTLWRFGAPKIFLKDVQIENILQTEKLVFKFSKEEVKAGETRLLKTNKNCFGKT